MSNMVSKTPNVEVFCLSCIYKGHGYDGDEQVLGLLPAFDMV